jgi:hypothetical protein
MDSERSCPGLIDVRTGSEILLDDWQYHAHATELQDSFWQLSPHPAQVDRLVYYNQATASPVRVLSSAVSLLLAVLNSGFFTTKISW